MQTKCGLFFLFMCAAHMVGCADYPTNPSSVQMWLSIKNGDKKVFLTKLDFLFYFVVAINIWYNNKKGANTSVLFMLNMINFFKWLI